MLKGRTLNFDKVIINTRDFSAETMDGLFDDVFEDDEEYLQVHLFMNVKELEYLIDSETIIEYHTLAQKQENKRSKYSPKVIRITMIEMIDLDKLLKVIKSTRSFF